MIADITALIAGIINGITSLISPTTGGTTGELAPYVALLAMPVLAGLVAFTRRLVKKAKN